MRSPNNKDWTDLADFMMKHGRTLIKFENRNMGRYQYQNRKFRTFGRMMRLISRRVTRARDQMIALTGDPNVAWVTIYQDGWQSKRKDKLGISIGFVDIENKELLVVPTGIVKLKSHKALPTAKACLKSCKKLSIKKSDLYQASNDNANAAKKA